jgi:two-component sensor histidine kinase
MKLLITLFLFLLNLGHFVMAQNSSIDKEIKSIDSLIQYNDFKSAQIKTDRLYQQLNNSKDRKRYKAQILEVSYRYALILDRQEASPAKSIQILQELIDEAESEHLYSLSCRIYLLMALAYEKASSNSDDFHLTDKYLRKAYNTYKKYKLNEVYSTYCIRKGSYHRYKKELDSTLYYATKANEYAKKYNNTTDLMDSYILLGNVFYKTHNYPQALKNAIPLLSYRRKTNDTVSIFISYQSISSIYFKMQDLKKALLYSDSASILYKKVPINSKYYFGELRYKIYESLEKIDSAYYYFKLYHHDLQLLQKEEEHFKAKKLDEQYQNDKKEAVIKNKNQQVFFISSLLALIVIASILLLRKNKKINKQNKIINSQLVELSKALEQKQMLLSELQHRVKNNLQHVISILEMQKESVDFNNIDELIRGNQNRIHSMALLHKKLNVSDNVNEIDFKRYITELSELVKESYDNHNKKISLNVKCEVENISIEKALPIGLIITELVSNSMKHAFKKRNIGIINLEITKTGIGNKFYYADNGDGYDFNKVNEKGLGQEIIKGLIDQLDGITEIKENNGFELILYFR